MGSGQKNYESIDIDMVEHFAKITPPQTYNVFERKRLFEKLDQARKTSKVIWISAPGGSGKTTLVASYLNSINIKPVWYQVDDGDADLASFYYYLGLATKRYAPRSRTLPLLTPEYQHGISAFTRNYFRQLFSVIKDRSVLVFDNVQDAGDVAEFNLVLQRLSDETCFNGQVIFISRSQFPASLSRTSLNKDLVHIDWSDLQLTLSECEELSSLVQEKNSRKTIQEIHKYTKGWLTGFILMSQNPDNINFAEEENFDSKLQLEWENKEALFDYFSNELFDKFDEQSKSILLKLSFLTQITADSAVQLTGNSNAKSVLSALVKNNYFIYRLGGSVKPFFEFHPLFRSFLISRCDREWSAEDITSAKSRTAEVCAQFHDYDNAARLYCELEMWDKLTPLIMNQAEGMVKNGRYQVLLHWIEALPDQITSREARLTYWKAMAKQFIDPFLAYELFETAFNLFEEQQIWSWCYLCWLGIAETIFFRQDEYKCVSEWMDKLHRIRRKSPHYPGSIVQAKITIEAFNLCNLSYSGDEEFDYWRVETEKLYTNVSNPEIRCIAGIRLALYYLFFAKSDKVLSVTQSVAKYRSSKDIRPVIRVMTYWAELTYSWYSGLGREQGPRMLTDEAMAISSEFGVHGADIWVYSVAIFNSLVFNELDTAQEFIEKYSTMGELKQRLYHSNYLFLLGWYELARGSIHSAIKHLEEARTVSAEINVASFYLLNTDGLVKAYIIDGQYEQARQLNMDIRQKSAAINNQHYLTFKSNMNQAWIDLRENKRSEAKKNLQSSFQFGEREQCIAGGAWLHNMLSELCEFALAEGIETEYARKLIAVYQLKPADMLVVNEAWPYPIKIYTLGEFRLIKNGEPVQDKKQATKKSIDIIKALISMGGVNINAQALSAALWPGQEGDASMNVLTTTLYRLRKFVGQDVIQYINGRISLNQDLCWVDVWTVEPELNHLAESVTTKLDETLTDRVDELLKNYRGSFLPADDDETWSLSMRERLKSKLSELILSLGQSLEKTHQYERAKKYYHRGLELNGLNERFYQGLMRCCLHLGLIAEGLATYQRCVEWLKRHFDVAPSAETEGLMVKLRD